MTPFIAHRSFASGLKPGQLYGFAELGRGVGFSLAERREGVSIDLGERAWQGYLSVLDRVYEELPGGFSVLVDNGAVQEVDLETMTAVAPISDVSWRLRMARYVELARRYGDAVWLITPDRVGDQQETIRRFSVCASALEEAAQLGATLVLTLQPGALGPVEFEAKLRAMIPRVTDRSVVPAFPMRPRGDDRRFTVTPISVLLDFLRQRRPRAVHLLGMGSKSRLLPDLLRQIEAAAPGTKVTLDSAEVRSVAVPGRPWIEEKPWAEEQIRRRAPYRQRGVVDLDMTELLFELEPDALRAAAHAAGVPVSCVERFVTDPMETYGLLVGWDEETREDPCWGLMEVGVLDLALERERFLREPKFPSSAGASERDRLLVHRVFGKK